MSGLDNVDLDKISLDSVVQERPYSDQIFLQTIRPSDEVIDSLDKAATLKLRPGRLRQRTPRGLDASRSLLHRKGLYCV